MVKNHTNTALIILAAGASKRMGSPKQLIKIQGKSLLEKMVETALETKFRPVVVVVGAYSEKIKSTIEHLPILILENIDWKSGMGSSIACGINYLSVNFPNIDGALITLADQPFVSTYILQKLYEKTTESLSLITAARYGGTLGPPAYFSKRIFIDLKELDGKAGAKTLFSKYEKEIAEINFPEGIYDVDKPEDVNKIKALLEAK